MPSDFTSNQSWCTMCVYSEESFPRWKNALRWSSILISVLIKGIYSKEKILIYNFSFFDYFILSYSRQMIDINVGASMNCALKTMFYMFKIVISTFLQNLKHVFWVVCRCHLSRFGGYSGIWNQVLERKRNVCILE